VGWHAEALCQGEACPAEDRVRWCLSPAWCRGLRVLPPTTRGPTTNHEGSDNGANDNIPDDELTSAIVLYGSFECLEETLGLVAALCERATAVARANTML